MNEMPIRLQEGEEVEIMIRSRLPINCPNIDPDCFVTVELHAPRYQEDLKRCETDDQLSHLIMGKTGCELRIGVIIKLLSYFVKLNQLFDT